jgi:hypothetical protein
MKRTLVLVVTSLLVLAACEARVADPVGDSLLPEWDLVEAGVDYRTDVTKVWLTYSPDSDRTAGSPDWELWSVLAQGEPHLTVGVLWGSYPLVDSRCNPKVDLEGDHTVTLTIDSACLEIDGKLPNRIQVAGFTALLVESARICCEVVEVDETDFTEPVGPWP